MIEFGMIHRIETNRRLLDTQLEQKPHLFLTHAARFRMLALVAGRQSITQPPLGAPDDMNIIRAEADFLVQFSVQGLFGGFADVDATLRKLPPVVTQATRPQHITILASDNHSDISAKTIGIYGFCNTFHGALYSRIQYPAVYDIRTASPERPHSRPSHR